MHRMRFVAVAVMLLLFSASCVTAQDRRNPPPNDPWVYNNSGDNRWDNSWNSRPFPRTGACFFTSQNFTGNRFCVRSGDRLNRLPGNFGDNISSIQIFGRRGVQVFNDRNFSGGSAVFHRSIPDLRQRRFRGGHTWNNRISSVAVM